MHEAILWESRGEKTACLLCPHACIIAEGAYGVCGVRRNVGGRLKATTYGRVSSIASDPIEKKPVFHYFPGSRALSIGGVGCTMRCRHCQNWTISRGGPGDGCLHDLEPEAVVDMAVEHDCLGVAFTYNEPVIWVEYVRDVARLCRERGHYTVMVTNGYITESGLDALGGLIDVWRVDVKGITDEVYRSLCKVPSVEPILRRAERARSHWHMHVEVVTNVIPGINDSEDELSGIASWISEGLGVDTPWHITRFFPCLDLTDRPATPVDTLRRARRIGRDAGLHHVYLGNVDEPGGEDTICPSCGSVALRRSGYSVVQRAMCGGACARCGASLNIVE